MLAVTILGNNSAIPAFDRHPTAQIVTLNEHLFLVDCGEGTQMQIARYKIRRSRINHIFISHLHGDHYFGLIGLLTNMGLLGREQELHLYAPLPLQAIIDLQLQAADTALPFPLHFHPLQEGMLIQNEKIEVSCFNVYHRIDCWGFIFREHGKGKSYAYSADTIFHEDIAAKVRKVDMLYHEATYLKNLEARAISRFHSTTVQAAITAREAGVQRLLLGHFSSKYETLDQFEAEAREIFPNTDAAKEGVTYTV